MNNRIQYMVSQLVDWYATQCDGLLVLDYDSIPKSDLDKLCAIMLYRDDDLFSEAAGPDNPEWEKSMKPALIESLQDDYFSLMDFPDIWKAGIRFYLKSRICKMIDERLEFINGDSGCHTSLIWDRERERAVEVRSLG